MRRSTGTCHVRQASGCGEDELLVAGAFCVYRGADDLQAAIDELGI